MDLYQIEKQLEQMNARIARLENKLNISTPPQPVQPIQAATIQPTNISVMGSPLKTFNLLGMVAVICFVLAAGFIIKLSIDSGWLTPMRQIQLAALLGLTLIISGFVLTKFDKEYASFLPGAGIIVLYLAAFAEYRIYSLVSYHLAIGLVTLISILSLYLNRAFKADIYSIIAAVGVYVGPLLLDFNATSVFTLYYYLICSLAFVMIGLWARSRTLTFIASYLAIITTGIVGLTLHQNQLVVFVLAMHFVVYSLGALYFSVRTHKPFSIEESWTAFIVLVLFYAIEYYYLVQVYPVAAPWISLGFAGFIFLLYMIGEKQFANQNLNSRMMVFAFTTLVVFHAGYIEILSESLHPWLFVVIFLSYAFMPQKILAQKIPPELMMPGLAVLTVLFIEYFNMISHLMDAFVISWLIVSFTSVLSIWIAILKKSDSIPKNEYRYFILIAAHFLAITAFYRLCYASGSLYVSISWLLYANCIITFAFVRKDKSMANSALIVLGFATAKVLLYDVSSAPTIIRIFCLLFTGIVLFASGLIMKKISRWDKQ
jgi:uncharacterized membrane protein